MVGNHRDRPLVAASTPSAGCRSGTTTCTGIHKKEKEESERSHPHRAGSGCPHRGGTSVELSRLFCRSPVSWFYVLRECWSIPAATAQRSFGEHQQSFLSYPRQFSSDRRCHRDRSGVRCSPETRMMPIGNSGTLRTPMTYTRHQPGRTPISPFLASSWSSWQYRSPPIHYGAYRISGCPSDPCP